MQPTKPPSVEVIRAVAVTAELCGRTFSDAAARMFVHDLAGFPDEAVLAALTRCRKEVRGVLTVQDVISRIDDGRPGVEEAWAMIPRDEQASVVWTEEMAQAHAAASPLLAEGDRIAARMAFKETYARLVAEARDRGVAARWTPSLGLDVSGQQLALIDAVRARRLKLSHALALLAAHPDVQQGMLMSLGVDKHPLLAAPNPSGQAKVKALLNDLKKLPKVTHEPETRAGGDDPLPELHWRRARQLGLGQALRVALPAGRQGSVPHPGAIFASGAGPGPESSQPGVSRARIPSKHFSTPEGEP